MKAPELAYSYRMPIDTASPTLELLGRSGSDSQTAVGVSVGFVGLPKDRVLILSNSVVRSTPGLAQAHLEFRGEYLTPTGLNIAFARQSSAASANLVRAAVFNTEIFIMGRGEDEFFLLFNATYDAGAVANQLEVAISGLVIPRANIALF